MAHPWAERTLPCFSAELRDGGRVGLESQGGVIRGTALTADQAKQTARHFACERLYPAVSDEGVARYLKDHMPASAGAFITEVSLESSTEDACEVIDELEAEQEGHAYSDPAGNGYCFVCGLEKDHLEAVHTNKATASDEAWPDLEPSDPRFDAE